MGTAAKKMGSAAKSKMGKLFSTRKKNKADTADAERVSVEKSSTSPKGAPPEAVKEENRERAGTFDSLESKLARWESMGEM